MNNVQVSKRIGINTLISWGASVVIVGLTFKILHWRGGEWMIGIGLLVEAVLFFLLGYASLNDRREEPVAIITQPEPQAQKFENMLATSIDEKVIDRLKQGFEQFNKTVESVNNVAGSSQTTQKMMSEIEHATIEIQELRKNLAELNNAYRAQLDAFRKS
jgi:hypothetical protein